MKQSLKKRGFFYYVFSFLFNFLIILFLAWLDGYLFKKSGISITNWGNTETTGFHTLLENNLFLPLLLVNFLLISMIVGVMGSLLGSIKGFIVGNFSLTKEERKIKLENPYIYFRELPNTFGIGVASILMDSEIESSKDIVATILDLCAKKYLKLECVGDFYNITILKTDISSLLSNEQYIMEAIFHHQIRDLDYKKWYQLCVQDGISLGLFQYRNEKNKFNDKKTVYNQKEHLKFCFFIIILLFIFCLPSMNLITLSFLVIGFVLLYIITYFPYIIFKLFLAFFRIGKQQQNIVYKHILNASLLKTEYGIHELHKLYAFKKFIRDFGDAASKNPEEIILWDYYLSYAQVFGLTKEIMKTGYEKLIKNASFTIDYIDNIQLYNIVFQDSKKEM